MRIFIDNMDILSPFSEPLINHREKHLNTFHSGPKCMYMTYGSSE